MKTFPTLYKKTATGATQQWTVVAQGNAYYTMFGQVGGTITHSSPVVCKGKNLGKANKTSPEEQAELEAEALHTKKLKKDYTLDPDVKAGQKSDLIAGGILPMLAHKFSDHGDKLVYPGYAQRKYDGHRCLAVVDEEGRCTLWSRTRKPILGCPHIAQEIESLRLRGVVLDGELFSKDITFEEISHFIRQSTPEAGYEIVQYHVYDAPSPGTFRQRWAYLQQVFDRSDVRNSECLQLAETREVQNEDELMLAFEDFLAQGYEGAIARNADGLYVNKRSYDLLKIKQFDDAEFKCIGVEEGKGKMAGHAIFVCVTRADHKSYGTEFRAKMKGDHAALAKYVKHPELVVGKQVTVKYQGLTGKNKVPRFPVALRIREES